MKRKTLGAVWLLALLVETSSAQVLITELAAAGGKLLDEDNAAPDWIELYNAGAVSVDLGGWHLTDDPKWLDQWTFPSTNLPAGGYLVVFASGKDRALAGARLHTNFRLAREGNYLGLVEPDGVTVAHEYAPKYPPQIEGISYGLEVTSTVTSFVTNAMAARWTVPRSAADRPSDWTSTNFDDSAWMESPTGLGFDASGQFANLVRTDVSQGLLGANASMLARFHFSIAPEEMPALDSLTLRMKFDDGFVAWLNGVEVAASNRPSVLEWDAAATAEHAKAAAVRDEIFDLSQWRGLLQEGENVLAVQGLNLSSADEDFLLLPDLSGQAVTWTERYFTQPTPGVRNVSPALGVVGEPGFSTARGFFEVPFTVALTSATAGAEIRYTTNGTAPTATSGLVYSVPLTIARTTVLRALAAKPGYQPSKVQTHTYVFLSDIITQNRQTATNGGFPARWGTAAADYAMSPVPTGTNVAQMTAALRSLPSLFLSTSISNLFSSSYGIYANPTLSGVAWERPISLEWVSAQGQSEFQVDCGLRMQGGAFRDPGMTSKHAFRLLFKGRYGPGRLERDLFPGTDAVKQFDTVVLRSGATESFAWSVSRNTAQYIRDEFGRRLQLAMGHLSAHGRFVHLYLDGLYWGMYNLCERPNEDFSAAYLGGQPADWDAINGGQVKNGSVAAWSDFTAQVRTTMNLTNYQKLQGNNPGGTRNASYPVWLDKPNYVDYMLLNIWAANFDWPDRNFWIARSRTPESTGFRFYVWDFEGTIGNAWAGTNAVSPDPAYGNVWVGIPHFYLKNFSEYKLDFADRAQRLFFNDGLLTPSVLTNLYRELAGQVEAAIPAEAARWRHDSQGLSVWQSERDWILRKFLPVRTGIVLSQFRKSGLYPNVGAPAFNRFGGAVPAGFSLVLTHTNASGTIFFTRDGSDPRVYGRNTVAPTAASYTEPIPIFSPAVVRARVLSGTQWSALVEAAFYPPQDLSALALTEIMYHPPNLGSTNGDEFEFLELKNTGTNTLDLSGLCFSAGITFTFTNGTALEPGQFFVLARNPGALATKYPGVTVQGAYAGKLDNSGEDLTLSDPVGIPIWSVHYGCRAPWPVMPDGFGFSLVPARPGATGAPSLASAWRASAHPGGSPGADDPSSVIPAVVVNEVLTHTDLPQQDAIELHNPASEPADIGGWFLTDDASVPRKFRIPLGTKVPGGGQVFFTEADFNSVPGTPGSFALDSAGDEAYLFSADPAGHLTGYNHGFSFGAAAKGVSFGRYVNSAGEESFPAQLALTLGQANAGARIGPVVFNEIHYYPGPSGDEFVELLNISGDRVPFFDPAHPANTWRLHGLGYMFPANVNLDPGGMLLLVATNPISFRLKYCVPESVLVLGPVPGLLQNGGERLEIQAPDTPDAEGLVPYVTIEEVRYSGKAPWPAEAHGTGLSLQRTTPAGYGNEPTNWVAAFPTPGQPNDTLDSDHDGLPDAWEYAHGTNPFVPDAGSDPDHDGFSNLQEFLAGTDPFDPESRLGFQALNAGADQIALAFEAMSNHSYAVLATAGLESLTWSNLVEVPAQPTNRVVVITNSVSGANARFFRLVTPGR